jgi:hypothetical protein
MLTWLFNLLRLPIEPVEEDELGDPRDCGCTRSGHWPALRAEHLEKHPRCVACGGKEQLEVHHRIPISQRPQLELDPTNLITLCEANSCHFVIGHLCSWRSWNPRVFEDATKLHQKIEARPCTD